MTGEEPNSDNNLSWSSLVLEVNEIISITAFSPRANSEWLATDAPALRCSGFAVHDLCKLCIKTQVPVNSTFVTPSPRHRPHGQSSNRSSRTATVQTGNEAVIVSPSYWHHTDRNLNADQIPPLPNLSSQYVFSRDISEICRSSRF